MLNSRVPGKNFLFVPGPTNLPDRVVRAMAVASEDHRSPTFPDLVKPLFPGLKKVFGTEKGHAFIFPASGTGGWEAAITNTLSPGDKVLAQRFGQFSHLWIDLCKRQGLEVVVQEREWGTGNDPELIEETLKADKNHEIKAVLATHNETATGVTSDIAAVRKASRKTPMATSHIRHPFHCSMDLKSRCRFFLKRDWIRFTSGIIILLKARALLLRPGVLRHALKNLNGIQIRLQRLLCQRVSTQLRLLKPPISVIISLLARVSLRLLERFSVLGIWAI